jgi:hypothetical protein
VTIECLASQGPPGHPPVRSGDYRDLKYAKTGFAAPRERGSRVSAPDS